MAIAGSLAVPMVVLGQTLNDDQWKNVMHAQRGKDFQFTVHTRDSGCAAGSITAVTKQTLTLKKKDKSKVTIARGNVLQLRELEFKPAGLVYSARSSWSDVAEVSLYKFLILVMRDGWRHEGQLLEKTNSSLKMAEGKSSPQITLLGDGKKLRSTPVTIAKADVSEVYEVTFKRMNSGADYLYSEMPVLWVLDPATWPAAADRGTLVLLYRSGSEEENEPVVCSHEL